MKTLIIPAAGKSSRFPNMRPKWLLTHPEGKLMIEEVLDSISYAEFDRVIITVLQKHCEDNDAKVILQQVFGNKVEIVVLKESTNSAVETILKTIELADVKGEIIIKDSDCLVRARVPDKANYIVGVNVEKNKHVTKLQSKSFIVKNEDNIVVDIIEKQVVSNIVCVGVYALTVSQFLESYNSIINSQVYKDTGELFVSHLVSYLIMHNKLIFDYVEADYYVDWGTKDEWDKELAKHKTYVLDIDGVFLKNTGKYGTRNWSNTFEPIAENIEVLKRLSAEGHQLIFMTARPEQYLDKFKSFLKENEINYKTIVSGCKHGKRIIVNDFANTNPYPSCDAISIKRNSSLGEFIK